MLVRIISWFWIAIGIVSILNPRWFKSYITNTGIKQARKIMMVAGIALSGSLVAVSRKISGVAGTAFFWLGVAGMFKSLLFLSGAIENKLSDWSSRLPNYVYWVGGVVYIALGVFMRWSAR